MSVAKRLTLFILSFVLLGTVFTVSAPSTAKAEANCNYQFYAEQEFGRWSDPCDTSCAASAGGIVVGEKNKDYTGTNDILSGAELAAIAENQPTYEQAGKESSVPWQAIAVLHLRETRLAKVNPSNGQGIYQDFAKSNGPYPTGPVSDEEFLRQSIWAGNFLKAKATNPELLSKGDEGQIKDAFFGYNGRASVYEEQAKSLGFTEAYEGSPYVVNKIDANRDPAVNPTKWGQIKTDGGSISYPANGDYGAFVVYASLAGIKSSSCSGLSGTINEKIVKLAQDELALWTSGQMKPGNDFKKYTYNIAGDWCAWFVSYILKGAGKPVNSSDTPYWSYVGQFLSDSPQLGFVVHQKGDGYKPKPGDLALYGGSTHINIVTGYTKDGSMITIGGNQGAGGNGSFTFSKVSENIGYGESATSYVEVK